MNSTKNKAAGGASLSDAELGVCSWCGEQIVRGEPTARSDGELMHLGCAAEDQENAFFDRDMGF